MNNFDYCVPIGSATVCVKNENDITFKIVVVPEKGRAYAFIADREGLEGIKDLITDILEGEEGEKK